MQQGLEEKEREGPDEEGGSDMSNCAYKVGAHHKPCPQMMQDRASIRTCDALGPSTSSDEELDSGRAEEGGGGGG